MSTIDELLKQDPKQLAAFIAKMKKWKKNREEYYKNKDQVIADNVDFIKKIKTGNNLVSKASNMRCVFRIPLDVYMSNSIYWDEIIKTKNFNKHPEWMTK